VSFEAESSVNTMPDTRTIGCSGCSGGKKVGYIGKGHGTLQFNNVTVAQDRSILVVISYVNGDSGNRTCQLSVNGGSPIALSFARTRDWSTTGGLTVRVTLKAGANRLLFSNPTDMAPDFDRITLLT
jgi:alpha-galactosidase